MTLHPGVSDDGDKYAKKDITNPFVVDERPMTLIPIRDKFTANAIIQNSIENIAWIQARLLLLNIGAVSIEYKCEVGRRCDT